MKNLKQVLALGMAFSLTMSTMAGAAFTDQDSINKANTEAVDLLTNLSIIKGYEDGSFKPEGTVTRAEMAKMIYTIRNGGNDDASAYESVDTSFTDIKGHWAEGYIKYLQNTGIVAGKSATKFDPDATVTTAEAMKMALVLGGYRSDKANLTGAEWFNNTVSWATTNQLTDDVFSAMNGPCTRASAAQILANALEMTAVQWSEFVNAFVNDSKEGLALGGQPITVGNKWMDLTVYVGKMTAAGDMIIDANDDNNLGDETTAGKDRFVVDVDTVDNVDVSKTSLARNPMVRFKDGIDHTDLVGQEVKVLTGEKIDEVYGVYATGTSQVVETTMDKITVDTANNKFEIGGTKYSVDAANANVYEDVPTVVDSVGTIFTVGGSNGKVVSDKVKLVDSDNDGKYETIFVETAAVAKLTYVGTDSITIGTVGSRDAASVGLSSKKTLENSEMSIYEGAAKGDYVVITRDDYNKESWKVEKATVVTGTVDGVVKNERKVRVDGKWYTLANEKRDGDSDGKYDLGNYSISGTVQDFVNKDKVTLYVVGDVAYYAEATKGNDVNRSVAMVYDSRWDAGDWNSSKQAKIILPDGTKKTVNVAAIDDSAPTQSGDKIGNIVDGKMYYYTVNNDGDYTFTSLSTGGQTAGYDNYYADNNGIDNNKYYGGYTIADDAIVFVYLDGKNDAKVYTGKAVKDSKITGIGNAYSGALVEENNGFTYTRMMNLTIDPDDQINSNTNYGYLVEDGTFSYNAELGCDVMEYKYWNGTEVVSVKEKTSSNKQDWATKGTIIDFTNDGEGFVKDVNETEQAGIAIDRLHYASMVGAASNGDVSLVSATDGTQTLKVTSDTVIYYVNSDAPEGKIGTTGSGYDYVVNDINDTTKKINVAYVKTFDDEVKFMVVDVDGQFANRGTLTEMSAPATLGDLHTALGNGSVVITGNANYTGAINVPTNRDLEVQGTLTIDTMPVLDGNASLKAQKIDASGIAGITASQIEKLLEYTDEVVVNGASFTGLSRARATATALNIAAGKTLNIAGAATMTNIDLTVDGNIKTDNSVEVGSGAKLTFNSGAGMEVATTLTMNGGNVDVKASASIATKDIVLTAGKIVVDGTMSVTNAVPDNSGNILVGSGIVTNNGGATYPITPDVQVTKVSL